MPNSNDRIFKENFFLSFLPVIGKLLGLEDIASTTELTDKLQQTLEREPDFVRKVNTTSGYEYILHLEFQTRDDKKMLQRMAEYHALLLRRYNLPIKHFVLFFGNNKPRMEESLADDKIFRGFTVHDMKDHLATDFLKSETPEEVVFAILGNFAGQPADEVVEQTLLRLQELTREGGTLEKYTYQLTVLSGLRKLEDTVNAKIDAMPLTIDINKNYFFKKGIEQGVEQGIEKGMLRERQHNRLRITKALLLKGQMTSEEIASIADAPTAFVEQVKQELEEKGELK